MIWLISRVNFFEQHRVAGTAARSLLVYNCERATTLQAVTAEDLAVRVDGVMIHAMHVLKRKKRYVAFTCGAPLDVLALEMGNLILSEWLAS